MQSSKVLRYQRGNQKPGINEVQTMQRSKVLRYQRGNQKPGINEVQTMQWPKTRTRGQTTIYQKLSPRGGFVTPMGLA
jgi:hypothetical protein